MDSFQPGTYPARVFLVEDDSLIRYSITAILNRNGFILAGEAGSGEEAIERIPAAKPDVLIMDISLSGKLDGISVAEKVGADNPVPVIFLTAMTDRAFLERAKRTAPYGYLTKPVDPKELIFTIEMALFRKEMESRIRASEEKYRSLVQTMTEGLGMLDENGILIEGNLALATMLGLEISQIPGTSFISRVENAGTALNHARMQEIIRTASQAELWMKKSDGERICIIFSPFNTSGKGIAFTAMDITERKIAEEKIKAERKLKELLHHVDHGILSGRQPREILRNTLRKARKDVLRCDLASFYFIDEQQGTADCFETSSVISELGEFAKGVQYRDLTSIIHVLRSGGCAWISANDPGKRLEFPSLSKVKGLDTVFFVPVFSGNRLSGTLLLADSRQETFQGDFQEQAQIIASEIGVLVAHSMLNQAFNNSRKLNNRILDLIPDSILIVDHSGNVVSFKEGANADFPLPKQGENFIRFLQRQWRPSSHAIRSLIEEGEQVLAEGENTCIEMGLDIPGKDRKIHVEVRLVHLFNRQLLAIIRDVTSEREGKEQIRHAILQTQEEERKRFASDLHDGLGQMLSALYMNLDALRHSRTAPELHSNRVYLNCLNLSQDSIVEARRIAHNLLPSALEREGLGPAIRKMVGQSFQSAGVEIHAEIHVDLGRFQPHAESCLYRIAQELLVNILRHSEASQAYLSLRNESGHLELKVEDNGKGFDYESAEGGIGIRNLKARSSLLGGNLSVNSAPGKGTRISLQVPLEKISRTQETVLS